MAKRQKWGGVRNFLDVRGCIYKIFKSWGAHPRRPVVATSLKHSLAIEKRGICSINLELSKTIYTLLLIRYKTIRKPEMIISSSGFFYLNLNNTNNKNFD